MVLLHETAAIVSLVAPTRVSVEDLEPVIFYALCETKSYYSRCFVAAEFGVCNESGAMCGLFCCCGRIANRRPDPNF